MEPATGRARDASSVQRIRMDRSVAEAARILVRPEIGALIVVDGDLADGTMVGLLKERDIFRALAARGRNVYDQRVWLVTDPDFPAIDIASSPRDRLQVLCDRKVDHIALMDGCRVSSVLSIWDCAGDCEARPGSP